MVVPLALLLISYPVGKFLAFSLPITTYRLPRWLGSTKISLNMRSSSSWPNVAVTPLYAMNTIVVVEKFYEVPLSFWFNLVLVLGTQLTGFGLAGVCRRFIV
jgi:hypothetical protein